MPVKIRKLHDEAREAGARPTPPRAPQGDVREQLVDRRMIVIEVFARAFTLRVIGGGILRFLVWVPAALCVLLAAGTSAQLRADQF